MAGMIGAVEQSIDERLILHGRGIIEVLPDLAHRRSSPHHIEVHSAKQLFIRSRRCRLNSVTAPHSLSTTFKSWTALPVRLGFTTQPASTLKQLWRAPHEHCCRHSAVPRRRRCSAVGRNLHSRNPLLPNDLPAETFLSSLNCRPRSAHRQPMRQFRSAENW